MKHANSMAEIEAARWLESTPGLTMHVCVGGVIISNGVSIEARGKNILMAVIQYQAISREMKSPVAGCVAQ